MGNDVGIYSYYHEKELTCRLAQQTTDLTIEDFEIQRTILHQLSTKVRFELEAIKDDVIAICVVSIANSNQVEYFKYNDIGQNIVEYMKQLKNKKFHINNIPYFLSCYEKTNDHTAKENLEQSVKDSLKFETCAYWQNEIPEVCKNGWKINHQEKMTKSMKYAIEDTCCVSIEAGEKWYETYKYHLGFTLLLCIIFFVTVTFSFCCCTTNDHDITGNVNNDPENHYPDSSDLVLDVLETNSSFSTVSSTESLQSSIHTITNSTVEEITQSNSIEPKEDSQSQSKSIELENTQSQTKSIEPEDAQFQSDALEPESTHSESESLF